MAGFKIKFGPFFVMYHFEFFFFEWLAPQAAIAGTP